MQLNENQARLLEEGGGGVTDTLDLEEWKDRMFNFLAAEDTTADLANRFDDLSFQGGSPRRFLLAVGEEQTAKHPSDEPPDRQTVVARRLNTDANDETFYWEIPLKLPKPVWRTLQSQIK